MMRAVFLVALLLAVGACSADGTGGIAQPAPRTRELPPAPPPPPMADDAVFCPADVQQCPDGSFVSRNPARNCVFDACPGETP